MLTFLVVLAVLLQISISLGVYYRRRGGHTNLIFMFLSLALAGWAFTNYIAITIPQNNNTLYAIRTVLFFVVIQNTLFYFFARTFPDTKLKDLPGRNKYLAFYSLLVALLVESPLVFNSVAISHGKANPNPSPFIVFFIIHALLTIIGGFRQLSRKLNLARGQTRRQLLYITGASTVLFVISPITNFVVTLSAKTTTFVQLSPFYTLLFGAFITYAIVAQKLFDIRAAVARSVAYVLLLGTLTAAYLAVFFGVVKVVFAGPSHETVREIALIVMMLPIVVSFQALKRYFDRFTNQLFYRDAYDTQEVLDKLGTVISAEIDLGRILSGTRTVLTNALNAEFMEFLLFEGNAPTLESPERRIAEEDIKTFGALLKHERHEVSSREALSGQNPLKGWFVKENIAICLKLKTQKQVVGFILIGDKRSGDIYSKQDLGLLMITADELAIAIQNALRFEEIQHFNVTLQEKVEAATKELRHANTRLKELDKTKDEFISMASHQLRTPLTTIKGYLSMVLEGDVGPVSKNERQMIQQAFDSSERMVFLIADLLNVSRLQSGKFVIENKPTDLAKMIEDEVNQLQDTAKNHHLTLTYKKPDKLPLFNLDETKIRQVVMNFMDNAIYYTPAGGNIEVKLEATDGSVNYTVTDTGLGVPKAEQHHLFSKFYRAGNARKMRPDGTGLGLFMAKKVIAAQGGAIIFKSEEGKGSTFGFTFPRAMMEVKANQVLHSS
ncbi:MAG TPA: ATP-binding protein [Candidatus Saccharimonadales bacterium]|nr:ATP-binding protein [Candidatus Saccharimonadales bacterium]